jgi:hypothetical protein
MLFGVRKDSTKKTYSVRYVGTDRRVGQRIGHDEKSGIAATQHGFSGGIVLQGDYFQRVGPRTTSRACERGSVSIFVTQALIS